MGFKVEVIGFDRLDRKLKAMSDELEKALQDTIERGALQIQTTAKRKIQRGSRSGKLRPDGSRSSAPGEAPKTDTGTLVSSIFVQFPVAFKGMVAEVGSDLNYAKHLELGTRKMSQRPWLLPSAFENKDRIKRQWQKARKAAISKAASKQ